MAIIIGSTSAGTLGTVTLADVKSIIQAHGYGTDTTAIQTTAIRAALRDLYGRRRWKFLRTTDTSYTATVSNGGAVSVAALGRGIMLDSVRLQDGTAYYDLRHIGEVEMERARYDDRGLGIPTHWSRTADTLLLYPRPASTYPLELLYQALTTLPSADGDSIIWPETHIMCVAWWAILVLSYRQRDLNARQVAKQEAEDALVHLMRDEEFTDRQTDLEVGKWDGWSQGGVELP